MTLDTVLLESAPGGLIKSDHVDTLVLSLSSLSGALTSDVVSLTSNVLALSADNSYFNLAISCTATDAPTIVNQRDANYGGTMTVTSISAGMYNIEHSGNLFSASSFFQLTSKTPNVIFAIGSLLGTSAVEVVIRDTNGFATSLSSGEGFIFKVEQ